MSVKVAVRVRPFNQREKDLGSELCVDMVNKTTVLKNPEDGKTKEYTFDYSFWSHDEFEEDENGYFKGTSDKYADQQKVFDQVGSEILKNAWEGYHCCLFAYGQTGAGKSYSMVGYGANKGIVPISCKEIFERIGQNKDPTLSFEVSFSMLEIYNEKIQDLLINPKERTHEGLKVREHQKYGVYVEGLGKHPVDSYESIEAKTDEGNKNRTIGSTMMNASSSRAHTIIQIEFKRVEMINNKKTEKLSVINLVDLAGSEKLAKTGASGDRMKEGCAINKSLSTLGLVISKLADKAMGKKNVIIPYRDSVLTRILQNALGGNSKTLMICAISPATDNYDETLSTLRYADQAKKIKNHAVVNESEQDKMIRELKEENERLKATLGNYNPAEGGGANKMMIDEETLKKYQEMEEQMKANALLMQQHEKSFQQKLAESKQHDSWVATVDKTKPYLMNLNEDPILSGKVLHGLTKDVTHIGKKNGDPQPDITLGGIAIKPNHAQIHNDEGVLTLIPADEECCEQMYVNGQKITGATKIYHNDRIIFGTNSIFVLKDHEKENESPNKDKIKVSEIDWEFAQTELVDTMNKEKKIKLEEMSKEREKEVEEKIKNIQEQYEKEKNQKEEFLSKQKQEFEKKVKELEEKMKKESENQKLDQERKQAEQEWKEQFSKYEAERLQKERERERMQKEVQEEATLNRFKEQEKIYLEHKLAKHLSHITEVNLIAKELKRNVTFSVKLSYHYVSGAELQLFGHDKKHKPKVQILVHNKETNCKYIWPMSKFTNRYFLIKDLLESYYESNSPPPKNNPADPFWDPPEPSVIGQGFISLESLAYLLDNPAEIPIVGDNGSVGKLKVDVIPINESGEPLGDNADIIDDPNELIDQRLDFHIKIDSAELPENFCQDTFCEYSFMTEDGGFKTFKTIEIKGKVSNPEYNYKYHHSFSKVNDKVLNYLLNHNLKIQLYGNDIPEEKIVEDVQVKQVTEPQLDKPQKKTPSPKKRPPALTDPSIDASTDDSSKKVEDDVWNEDPGRYRQTMFAPGAAVNTNKAVTPKISNANNNPKTSTTAQPKQQPKTTKAQGGKKKEDCNIF